MKGLKYQLKSVLKDKFCLMTFLLPIAAAVALHFMGSIDLSSLGEHHFGVLKNDLPPQTVAWLERYGPVTSYETAADLCAAINDPSTNLIGVKADGAGIKTVISGDELEIFRQTAATLPALYAQREDAEHAEIQILERPDILERFQDIFIPAVLIAAMFMGCTFNAMNIISEKEDGVAFVNAILPITPSQYILQKVVVGFLCGSLSSIVTAILCFRLSWRDVWIMLALILLSSFVAALLGLFIGMFSESLMVGVVYIKIVMLLFIAVPVLYALAGMSGPLSVICYLVPSQPAFEGIMALSGENWGTAIKDIGVLAIHGIAWFALYILISTLPQGRIYGRIMKPPNYTIMEETAMNHLGIVVDLKHIPPLDQTYIPLLRFNRAFLASAKKPVSIAVERADGQMAVCHTFIHGTPEMAEADRYYMNRLVKTILWMKGGFKIYVSGDADMYQYLRQAYSAEGQQAFDWDYMSNIFERPFEVVLTDQLPEAKDEPKAMGGHLQGCRIGFDAGGSDRKVSAVIDGETVYSEEVVWFPKITPDPDYHYEGITAALKSAAGHMPRVDGVGVSSAGILINNRVMNASLFLAVPKEIYDAKVKDIYIRAITDTFGDIPYAVLNDGDVSALAGAMSLEDTSVLGIAMGTSEAVGYVDEQGRVTGWLNELAFVPVDAQPDAMRDEWSGDIGCGVKYFSQDGVIKLAPRAGIELDESLSPAEKLKVVQKLMEEGSEAAAKVYESIGVYLGHTLAYYYELYGCRHVLLLGRVMSGKGGDLILETAQKVLADEYPELAGKLKVELPDEKFRRVGQSMAAASLPVLPDGQ